MFDFMGEKSKTNTKTVRPVDPGQTRLLVASEIPCWPLILYIFNIVLYRHANVVTSASEQNFNSGDMALYKLILLLLLRSGLLSVDLLFSRHTSIRWLYVYAEFIYNC